MLKMLLLGATLLTLSGCANIPEQVNISTNPVQLTPLYNNIQVTLTSQDIRQANYLIAIHKAGQAAKLINNQVALSNLIATRLQQGWQQQGIVIADDADITANIAIQTARVDVQQDNFEYVADSQLVLIVTVTNKGQTLNKQFRSSSTLAGAFNPVVSELEAKLTQQLNAMLSDIFADPQIRDYLSR